MRFQRLLDSTLEELRASELLREPDDGSARSAVELAARQVGLRALDASSNDYLGLASSRIPVSRETGAVSGAAASRLIDGTTLEHLRLEALLAEWVGLEASLLFSSTYAANLGLISALGAADCLIISDAHNHASLIDGARLAKAEVRVVPHLEMSAFESSLRGGRRARACFVVTESYFSMDGDGPDLVGLRALCDNHDAGLIVDEAHAFGVFGPAGAGRCAEFAVRPDAQSGSLGKAVGSQGGFVAGSRQLRRLLWNRARSFVFSTAVSPRHAELTATQVERARSADVERRVLAGNAARLRAALLRAGLPIAPRSFGPIISVILGENARVMRAAAQLRQGGILAQAIRPPTVPAGGARLRLTVKSTFDEHDLDRLADAVTRACSES